MALSFKQGKVLITGASGLVGRHLVKQLVKNGWEVHTLGRGVSRKKGAFTWDVNQNRIDEKCIGGVTHIVHLAGAGVADERWTSSRKQEILHSRVKSTRLLYQLLERSKHTVNTIVSASAVGYYGDCGSLLVHESHPAADTYLADVCKQWETEVARFGELGIREVRCRIGIILAKEGGALPELTKTLPLGVAGYFNKSNLYYPWIHIDDVCGIMEHALLQKECKGAYNTTADNPLQLKDLMREVVRAKHSSAVLLPVPTIALKMAMGEMADMLLSSQKCSAQKIIKTGYRFRYPDAASALNAIFQNKD